MDPRRTGENNKLSTPAVNVDPIWTPSVIISQRMKRKCHLYRQQNSHLRYNSITTNPTGGGSAACQLSQMPFSSLPLYGCRSRLLISEPCSFRMKAVFLLRGDCPVISEEKSGSIPPGSKPVSQRMMSECVLQTAGGSADLLLFSFARQLLLDLFHSVRGGRPGLFFPLFENRSQSLTR